jgi:hypothetical protein
MDNILIISRDRANGLFAGAGYMQHLSYIVRHLDFYGVREPDGTITPLKNRFNDKSDPLTQKEFDQLVGKPPVSEEAALEIKRLRDALREIYYGDVDYVMHGEWENLASWQSCVAGKALKE